MANSVFAQSLLLIIAFAASWFLTGMVKRYAIRKELIDVPNTRSSHSAPTPRGGGIAIVAVTLIGFVVLAWQSQVSASFVIALVGSGALVALIGFWDDHGHVAARWRLLAHFIAAAWGLYWLGGLPPLSVGQHFVDLGLTGTVLSLFYLVWCLNLFNFMDGIDGIAGVEVFTVALVGSCVTGLTVNGTLWLGPLLLATAAVGFLVWNFPPAKIFMGDVGSASIGVMLGLMSIKAAWMDPKQFWVWVILLGVFMVDATVTLFRRILKGEKVYEAHRSHAYQYASRKVGAHLPVTVGVGLINIVWLTPVAYCAAIGLLSGTTAVIIAYIPLIFLALNFKAGDRDAQEIAEDHQGGL